MFQPKKIYYELDSLNYNLGKFLYKKYENLEWIEIENHNNIEVFRKKENKDFPALKQNLIVGIRKTHKFVPNHKTSDFLVPYTSSGCSAMCLYCYLVCNYNKCSYLRLFVNREEMLDKIIRVGKKSEKLLTFEIGSNSDLILENTITNNLIWTIEKFAKEGEGFLTLPTKFDMVKPLLELNHAGKTIIRMSVNPEPIIDKIEIGTSSLDKRIEAINNLCEAGYKVGIIIAPVILLPNWENLYQGLLNKLDEKLSQKVKDKMFIEIIFMTYSYVQRKINEQAFPNADNLYNHELMTGRGNGKYCYRLPLKKESAKFLIAEISKRFPDSKIEYVV